MRGSDSVIEVLNEVLTAELTAINQYFLDAKMCENCPSPSEIQIRRRGSAVERTVR